MKSATDRQSSAGRASGRDGTTHIALDDVTVGQYLKAHPDFLLRHPDVLAQLQIPHQTQGAVSLIERQVAVLRQQLGTERSRLNAVMTHARDYEAVAARLHRVMLAFIAAPEMDTACKVLRAHLCDEFATEAVALKLFPANDRRRMEEPLSRLFADFIATQACVCGEVPPPQGRALFGEEAGKVRSAALVPINGADHQGVLAIGSTDPERFTPDMGTDLLERFRAVVSAKLNDLLHRERHHCMSVMG